MVDGAATEEDSSTKRNEAGLTIEEASRVGLRVLVLGRKASDETRTPDNSAPASPVNKRTCERPGSPGDSMSVSASLMSLDDDELKTNKELIERQAAEIAAANAKLALVLKVLEEHDKVMESLDRETLTAELARLTGVIEKQQRVIDFQQTQISDMNFAMTTLERKFEELQQSHPAQTQIQKQKNFQSSMPRRASFSTTLTTISSPALNSQPTSATPIPDSFELNCQTTTAPVSDSHEKINNKNESKLHGVDSNAVLVTEKTYTSDKNFDAEQKNKIDSKVTSPPVVLRPKPIEIVQTPLDTAVGEVSHLINCLIVERDIISYRQKENPSNKLITFFQNREIYLKNQKIAFLMKFYDVIEKKRQQQNSKKQDDEKKRETIGKLLTNLAVECAIRGKKYELKGVEWEDGTPIKMGFKWKNVKAGLFGSRTFNLIKDLGFDQQEFDRRIKCVRS